MQNASQPRTIRVKIVQQSDGLYTGTSPDLSSLSITEQSSESVQQQAAFVIKNIFASMGQKVTVSQTGHDATYTDYSVTPSELHN